MNGGFTDKECRKYGLPTRRERLLNEQKLSEKHHAFIQSIVKSANPKHKNNEEQ